MCSSEHPPTRQIDGRDVRFGDPCDACGDRDVVAVFYDGPPWGTVTAVCLACACVPGRLCWATTPTGLCGRLPGHDADHNVY